MRFRRQMTQRSGISHIIDWFIVNWEKNIANLKVTSFDSVRTGVRGLPHSTGATCSVGCEARKARVYPVSERTRLGRSYRMATMRDRSVEESSRSAAAAARHVARRESQMRSFSLIHAATSSPFTSGRFLKGYFGIWYPSILRCASRVKNCSRRDKRACGKERNNPT